MVSEDASTVISVLRMLFIEHGAPLVIKADNAPGFIAEATRSFIEAHGAWLLLSPPHMPEYNGSAEAGIGSMKTRTHHQAALHDRPGEWTPDDFEAARCQANETARPRGWKNPTPDAAWKTRTPITEDERSAFARDLLRWERLLSMGDDVRPSQMSRQERDTLRQRALTTVLFERGFLGKRRGRLTAPKAA